MSSPLQPGTPASALFDESALPQWLRQASGGQDVAQQPTTYQPAPGMRPSTGAMGMPPTYDPAAGMGGYQAQPAPQAQPQLQPRAAFPSIEQVGAYGAPAPVSSALSGPALIDPSSLPAWLGGQAAAPVRSGGIHSTGMPAQALIDESALPTWLRAEPQAVPQAPSAAPAAPPTPGSGRLQWAPPTVDEPLPSWLNQVYADANVPRIGTGAVGAEPWPAQAAAPFGAPTGPTVPDSRRLAASSLMDDGALPDWLKIQGAQGAQSAGLANPPASAGLSSWQLNPQPERAVPPYIPGGGQSGGLGANVGGSPSQFAASDLIDPDAVPSWVRGDAPQQQASFSSTLGWTSKQPSVSPGSAGLRGEHNPPGSGLLNLDAAQQPGTGGFHSDMGGFYSGMLTEETVSPWSSRPLEGASGAPGRGQSDQLPYNQGGQFGGYGSGSLQGQQGHRVPREYDHSGPLPEEFADRPSRGSGDLGARPRGYSRGQYDDDSVESASRRQGPPIPFEELPPWLRAGTDARGAQAGYGAGADYGDDFPGEGDGEWWPEDEEQAPQWNDWGDEGAGADYGGEYPGYSGYAEYAQGYDDDRAYRDGEDRKRGGWRRLFGRR